jgi:hypothetical protein
LLTQDLSSRQKYSQAVGIIAAAIDAVRRRQAVLQALEDQQLGATVDAWIATGGTAIRIRREETAWTRPTSLGDLILAGDANNPDSPIVRASHSGGVVDGLLPQGPYNPALAVGAAPAQVGGIAGPPVASTQGLVGRVNWAALVDTKDDHTTGALQNGAIAADPNRVASYFEITLKALKDGDSNKNVVPGGRVVYDPFNQRYFVSSHYHREFEVVQVPVYRSHPAYQALVTLLQNAHGQNPPLTQQQWFQAIDQIYAKMMTGEY